jgi:hypothetical protein
VSLPAAFSGARQPRRFTTLRETDFVCRQSCAAAAANSCHFATIGIYRPSRRSAFRHWAPVHLDEGLCNGECSLVDDKVSNIFGDGAWRKFACGMQ